MFCKEKGELWYHRSTLKGALETSQRHITDDRSRFTAENRSEIRQTEKARHVRRLQDARTDRRWALKDDARFLRVGPPDGFARARRLDLEASSDVHHVCELELERVHRRAPERATARRRSRLGQGLSCERGAARSREAWLSGGVHEKVEPGEAALPRRSCKISASDLRGEGGGTSVVGDLGRWCGTRESSRRSAIEQPHPVEGSKRRSHQEVEPEHRRGPADSKSPLWAVSSASAWVGRGTLALLMDPSICEHKGDGLALRDSWCGLGSDAAAAAGAHGCPERALVGRAGGRGG